jgi:aryl-alcohol dehydrogenase-like predicted oxidoreductase
MPVTRLSFGTAQLGMAHITASGVLASETHASSMLHSAYELGISSFDTSPDYGHAEQRIGAFLRDQNLHEEVAICTKLPSFAAVDPRRVEQQVEDCLTASLRRLRGDVIDTYLVHQVSDLARHGQALVDALAHQRDKGRVLAIGVAVDDPADLALIEEYPELGVVQHPFSLLDRRLSTNGWPERLAAGGTRLNVSDALFQGLLALPSPDVPEPLAAAGPMLGDLQRLLGRFGLEPVDTALPFALSIDPDSVVVAADTIPELQALVTSANAALPDELYAAIGRELPDFPAGIAAARPELCG